jgi:hypothetical protein
MPWNPGLETVTMALDIHLKAFSAAETLNVEGLTFA